MTAACDRVDDCMRRILREPVPVHSLADIMLVAEACYWALWTDPQGLRGPDADVRLAEGPDNEGPVCDVALAALFRTIRRVVDVADARPSGT